MARRPSDIDPRTLDRGEQDVRPQVAMPSSGPPVWLLAAGLGLLAIILFSVLNARRQSLSAPSTRTRAADASGTLVSPPPLYVPPVLQVVTQPTPQRSPTPTPSPTPETRPAPAPTPIVASPPPVIAQAVQVPPIPRSSGGPVLVVDNTSSEASTSTNARNGDAVPVIPEQVPTHAIKLVGKATTVIQGTLIPAVLESALDSTRPGPARALVTQDVRGWDGSRVLIQRGTRLFGEYRADVQPGQSRVQIVWTRLIRPDGATINLGSPAGDTLGRVGVKGKVNSHFFARFGGAILQTGLDIGANLATQAAGNSVIVAVPGSIVNSNSPQLFTRPNIPPTIRVAQGTSITVFVAHDLDFTSVETHP